MTAPAPALTADLVAGLRRLKLARIRAIAAEVCQAAKTQRWAPDEFLRTLIEAEIASRDESNLRARLKLAGFPVRKSLDEFKVQLSSVPQATFDYLAGLEWIRAQENCLLIGPAGTGKSHLLLALGHAAVEAGYRVRYFAATGGQLLFRFVAAAYERRSLGIASHSPFNEWGHFLPDETTAVSLIDRLLHHAVVLVTAGESFRMREARTRGGGVPLKVD